MSGDRLEDVRLRLAVGAVDPATAELGSARARRAVEVARAAGAPLGRALDGAAEADADARRAARAVGVAGAQTRAVAGGLVGAPVLLLPALAGLLDLDLLAFYGQPVGWLVGGVGLTLLGVGAAAVAGLVRRAGRPRPPAGGLSRWLPAAAAALAVAWLVGWWLAPAVAMLAARARRPEPPLPDVDEVADLTATALAGGTAPAAALREVARVRPDLAPPLGRLAFDLELGLTPGPHPEPLDRVASLLTTAAEVGAAPDAALRRLAAQLRADELARVLAAAERLPAQLTFPTALCLLPAVLLLIGAPIVHAGLSVAGT